jgi:predicted flap endonuclease-1-like 5' DNA nuclease
MSMLWCFLWWLLLGGLLGWLGSWLVGKWLSAPAPAPIERIVEKPVERIAEKPVDRIVERPVDRIVEKIVEVEKKVDNPAHLARIASLESELALLPGLRNQVSQLQSAPPKVVEKLVEKTVVDTKGLKDRDQQIAALHARVTALEDENRALGRGPTVDLAAAKAAGFQLKHADDLEIIEGIGPKIAELLRADGVTTFLQLAAASPDHVRGVLDKAGPQYRIADPGTWPEQADLAAHNRWQSLASLQAVLDAGVWSDPRAAIKGLRADLAARDAELRRLSAPVRLDIAAAKAAGFDVNGPNNLEIIEGIGPKIAELLRAEGINTFAVLARTSPTSIQNILDKAGPNFRMANPETWPEQSALAAVNQWHALKALQDKLIAGNR